MIYTYLLQEDGSHIVLDGGQGELLQENEELLLTESGDTFVMEENVGFIQLEGVQSKIIGIADANGSATGILRVFRLHRIQGEAIGVGSVTSDMKVIKNTRRLSQDNRYVSGQPRPNFPFIVYHTDVRAMSDLTVVPDNGYFLVSVLYNKETDDPQIAAFGGFPCDVGQKYVQTIQGTTLTLLLFRPPEKREVVCYKGSLILFRFDDGVWNKYQSYPQRFLTSCMAFDIFDAAKVYDYFAQLLGAAQYQWSFDSRRILEFKVAGLCPADRLPYLAEHFGQSVRADETELQKRGKILLGMECSRHTGTPKGVELRLQALGYFGQVFEVWVYPDHPEIYRRPPNQSAATPFVFRDVMKTTATSINGAIVGNETVFQFGSAVDWSVGDTLEATPATGKPALFTISAIHPGNTFVYVSCGASAPFLAAGVTFRIVKRAWLTIPHGFTSTKPDKYWPSSRSVVAYANKDGTPISEAPQGFAGIAAFEKFLAEQLYDDVLPMAQDIRAFASIVGYSKNGDGVVVSDTLSITNIP